MTHLSMEVEAVGGVLIPKSLTSFNVQLVLKAEEADYVLTSCQLSLSSCSDTCRKSDDGNSTVECSAVMLHSTQSTSKHSRSIRIHYVTTKRHTDCRSMEQYLMGRPSTIMKQSKFNRDHSKKYEYHCCICG
jgi:hypothetical protein